jgi:hypothetical protein
MNVMNGGGTILVYAGLLLLFIGGVSVLRPLRFLNIWSRFQGLMLLAGGAVVLLIGANLPVKEQRIEMPVSHLDAFMPAYQFGEFHSIRIHAPRERVYAALREVTADDITFFRTLTWIRPKGTQLKKNPTPEDFKALAAPQPLPPAQGSARSSEQPGQAVDSQTPEAMQEPDTESKEPEAQSSKGSPSPQESVFALAAINFRLEEAGKDETLLTTETRVYATDASTQKKFAAYWRIIYPGSALIRVMWLRAIRDRAEQRPS